MNSVQLIGRLTRDPEVRYTASQMAVATFTIAINRPVKSGEEQKADFPRITVFGRQAENCEKYLNKGNRVAIEGRIQTESYQNKNGDTVYTTDVVASRVEFLESRNAAQRSSEQQRQPAGRTDQRPASRPAETQMDMTGIPPAFEEIEDAVPF